MVCAETDAGEADLLIGVHDTPGRRSITPTAAAATWVAYLIPASSFFDGETVSLQTLVARPGVYAFHIPVRWGVSATTGAIGDVDGDGLDDLLLGMVSFVAGIYAEQGNVVAAFPEWLIRETRQGGRAKNLSPARTISDRRRIGSGSTQALVQAARSQEQHHRLRVAGVVEPEHFSVEFLPAFRGHADCIVPFRQQHAVHHQAPGAFVAIPENYCRAIRR